MLAPVGMRENADVVEDLFMSPKKKAAGARHSFKQSVVVVDVVVVIAIGTGAVRTSVVCARARFVKGTLKKMRSRNEATAG